MNSDLRAALKHASCVFRDIIVGTTVVVVLVGACVGLAYGFLTLSGFVIEKLTPWVGIPVCFLILAFSISVFSAVSNYFKQS